MSACASSGSWDLVDQSHRPIAVQSVSSNAISSLRFCQPTHALQYLAAGDAQGDLHILDIPRALRRKIAAEEELMQRFYQRELDRLAYYRALPTLPQPPSSNAGSGSGSGKGPAALSAEDLKAREEEARAAELAADEKAEADYQKQLQRFKQELGMAKEAKEE